MRGQTAYVAAVLLAHVGLHAAPKAETQAMSQVCGMKLAPEALSEKSVEAIDDILEEFRKKIGCTTATIAIGKDQKLIFAKGYGSLDAEGKKPAEANAIMGIASCEKPVTAAAIRQACRKKGISIETKLVSLIKPTEKPSDVRVTHVSLKNLLEHKIGLPDDHSLGYHASGKKFTEAMADFYRTGLKEEPGKTFAYSNFSYDILRHLVTEISKEKFADYYNRQLFPAKNLDFIDTEEPISPSLPVVSNAPQGGPVAASALSLCRFMDNYWLNGMPRDKGGQVWSMNGSLSGSTTLMRWLPEGYNVVIIFNGRKPDIEHADIEKKLIPKLSYTRRSNKVSW